MTGSSTCGLGCGPGWRSSALPGTGATSPPRYPLSTIYYLLHVMTSTDIYYLLHVKISTICYMLKYLLISTICYSYMLQYPLMYCYDTEMSPRSGCSATRACRRPSRSGWCRRGTSTCCARGASPCAASPPPTSTTWPRASTRPSPRSRGPQPWRGTTNTFRE